MSTNDNQGNIVINCQECNRTCVIIQGKAVFSGIGMSVRCTSCESWIFRHKQIGGGKAF